MIQLKTCSTDFSNAFVLADIKGEPIYISPPPMMGGFPREKVLKLNKIFLGKLTLPGCDMIS
eukprot:12336608-Ditylum_brightwellii.AAC.1